MNDLLPAAEAVVIASPTHAELPLAHDREMGRVNGFLTTPQPIEGARLCAPLSKTLSNRAVDRRF
jgi:hypothetical protein